MKKITIAIAAIIFLLLFIFIGLNVVPFEKWTGVSAVKIMFIAFSVVLGLYIIGLTVFVIINRRKKIVEVVEFSAPNDMTPADAGYVIDKTVDDRDVSALLIYWAHKKYIEVDKNDERVLLKKIKDADEGMKSYEKTLFAAIFSQNSEVNLKDLPQLVRQSSNTISRQIKEENNQKYFNSKMASATMYFTLGITVFLVFLSYFFGNGGGFSIFCGVVLFAISTIFSGIASKVYVAKRLKGFVLYILGLILFLIFGVINLAVSINDLYITILIAFTTIACLLTFILCPLVEFRTKEGQRALGALLGLKKSIEIAEKEKMEKMVKDNPQLFYKILPYAYVLNVSNEWIDEFNFTKTINKKEKRDVALALGALVALCLLGQGAELLGGIFGKTSKTKKQK